VSQVHVALTPARSVSWIDASPMKARKHNLLIVDDDQDHLLLAQLTFESLATTYKVQLVTNGDEAIAYLKGDDKFADRKKFEFPSYILTDLQMNPGDGFSLAGIY